jgi:hypothetical protein
MICSCVTLNIHQVKKMIQIKIVDRNEVFILWHVSNFVRHYISEKIYEVWFKFIFR